MRRRWTGLAVLPVMALTACDATTRTRVVLSAEQLQRMCQAEPEVAVAIAEQFDHWTQLDGPGFVRDRCDSDDPALDEESA